jgi:uncharacterized phage protein (TIGR02218 family)
MLTLPAALTAHLDGNVTSLTACWAVTRRNRQVIRGTAHDRDVPITSGVYAGTYPARAAIFASDVRATSDGSVSNLDVEGTFLVEPGADDITVEEIEGGLYDQASAVLFLVNWQSPNDGQRVLVAGTLGEFFRDSDGRYRSEVRGLAQALSQQIVDTHSATCNVRLFGDERCKFVVSAVTRTATVTSVISRRRFAVSLDAGAEPGSPVYFHGGRLAFTSGANEDVIREARVVQVNGSNDAAEILLWDEEPADIQIGDTLDLPPGCDRQYETCRLIHDNLVNYRGYGLYAAGRDALMRGPGDTGEAALTVLSSAEYQALLQAVADAAAELL